jgi:hypothetical protein
MTKSKQIILIGIIAATASVIGLLTGCSSNSTNNPIDTTHVPTPTLTITAPNGGENWFVGRSANIGWTSTNLTGNVKIEFTPNYGADPWQTLVGSLPYNTQSYIWNIAGTKTTSARVRITSVEQPTVGDTSNANFSLVACPAICENAAALAVNEAITLCTITASGPDTINWFVINLAATRYRFQLYGLTTGQDLDFYVKTVCGGDNIFWGINGIETHNGTEDTTWTPPVAGDYLVSIRRPAERPLNHGAYTFVISPAPAALAASPATIDDKATKSTKIPAVR